MNVPREHFKSLGISDLQTDQYLMIACVLLPLASYPNMDSQGVCFTKNESLYHSMLVLELINLNTQWCSLEIVLKISDIFSESFSFIWIKLIPASNLMRIHQNSGFILVVYVWVKVHFFFSIWFEQVTFLEFAWVCLILLFACCTSCLIPALAKA